MLKIIAAATFSAMCRDLGPLSPVFRWVARAVIRTSCVAHCRLNARHAVATPRNLRNLRSPSTILSSDQPIRSIKVAS